MKHILVAVVILGGPVAFASVEDLPRPVSVDEVYRIPVSESHRLSKDLSQPEAILSSSTQTFRLDWAIREALENNPELQAMFEDFRAKLEQVPQVESLPDPTFSYAQFVEGVQTRTGEQEFILGISQKFPWFGKLTLKGRIADEGARAALEQYRESMLAVRNQVAQAYFALHYQYLASDLTNEEKAYLEQFRESASALYETGRRSRQAVLKAETELARIDNELLRYPSEIRRLGARLNHFLNRPPEAPLGRPVDAPLRSLDLNQQELLEKALSTRPELRGISHRIEQAEQQRALARKDYWPDVSLGVNYIGIGDNPVANPAHEGEDAWNVMVMFNIPLPNARRRAQLREAERRRDEALLQSESVENRIASDLEDVVARLTNLRDQLLIYEDSLIPFAAETLETSRSDYMAGESSFLDLLDAERTLIRVRMMNLAVRRDYQIAVADLERIMGVNLDTSPQDDNKNQEDAE